MAFICILLPLRVEGQSEEANLERFEGTLTVMTGDMVADDETTSSDIIYLLQVKQPALVLYELQIPPQFVHGPVSSGDPVVVAGYRLADDRISVLTITPATVTTVTVGRRHQLLQWDDQQQQLASAAAAAVTAAMAAADAATAVAAAAAAAAQPRMLNANANTVVAAPSDGPTGMARAAAGAAAITNTRVVRDMPILYMILNICGFQPAISVQDLEKVLFSGPGSRGPTLESYYYECSRGKSAMNRGNSMIIGPITVPCSHDSSGFRFSTTSCAYRDAWGWHTWAQQYAATALSMDLSRFRHRVAILPRGFTYEAGCPWMGLGTLGPVERGTDGSYISSMAWIQGESSTSTMAYMHELGHNLYLHHANDSTGCEYCDYSSLMGGCCALRCHNAPHNWQLGWGAPLAVLNSATFPTATWLYFNLPATNAAVDANIIWLQPDWTAGGRREVTTNVSGVIALGPAPNPVSYYISYRIDSGKYDADMPDMYLYATNVYFWDGASQISVRRTRHVASVFTDEEYRSLEEGWVIKQTQHGVGGGRVGVCRFTEARETSCSDGQDNDCDGYVDRDDTDCSQPSPPPSPPPSPRPPPAPRTPPQAEPPGIWNETPPGDDDKESPPPAKRRPPHPSSPPPPPDPPSTPPPPEPPRKSPPPPPPKKSPPPSPPSPRPPSPPPPSPSPPSPPPPSPQPPVNTDIEQTKPDPNQGSQKKSPPPTTGRKVRPPPAGVTPAAGGKKPKPPKPPPSPPPPSPPPPPPPRPPSPAGSTATPITKKNKRPPPAPSTKTPKKNKGRLRERRLAFQFDRESEGDL